MKQLEGFQLQQEIAINKRTIVYRALRDIDKQNVVVKTINSEYPTLNEIEALEHEYHLCSELDIEGIIKPLQFIRTSDQAFLIYEDYGGLPLNRLLQQQRFTIKEFLQTKSIWIAEKTSVSNPFIIR